MKKPSAGYGGGKGFKSLIMKTPSKSGGRRSRGMRRSMKRR